MEKNSQHQPYVKVRLALNIYIALCVTVLGFFVVPALGTNDSQNHRIAEQARLIANTNAKESLAGCQRSNFVRAKLNIVAHALSALLSKSVASSEAKGIPLTLQQKIFVQREYRRLRPLTIINCKAKYTPPKRGVGE